MTIGIIYLVIQIIAVILMCNPPPKETDYKELEEQENQLKLSKCIFFNSLIFSARHRRSRTASCPENQPILFDLAVYWNKLLVRYNAI